MGERIWVAPEFAALFRAHHLDLFQDFMKIKGTVLRELPDRTNLKFVLSHKGESILFFMKKHRSVGLRLWFIDFFHGGKGRSPGRREGERILTFREQDIPTMVCAAWGEDGGKRPPSFVITEEVDGTPLDDAIEEHWAAWSPTDRRSRIMTLASLVSKLHGANYYHRDLYLCHVFLEANGSMVLLDLQRVGWGRWVRSRWFVKDIAALNASAPEGKVSRAERLRFFKAYRGIKKIGSADRRFLRRVLRKSVRIRRHAKKKEAGGKSSPE